MRRTPFPLPQSRFVPGLGPRPHPRMPPDPTERFAYGLDLLASGFYWEAHEALEPLWRAAEGRDRSALKGLIQAAAAALKQVQGLERAEQRLRHRAAHHLRQAAVATSAWRGLDLHALADDVVTGGGVHLTETSEEANS